MEWSRCARFRMAANPEKNGCLLCGTYLPGFADGSLEMYEKCALARVPLLESLLMWMVSPSVAKGGRSREDL